MKSILIGLSFLLIAFPAWAWNAAGHRLVAAIAWRQMSLPTQEKAAELLKRHPDYPRWTAKASENPAYTAFLEASNWADDIRRDPRFYDDGSTPTDPFPGMPDTARHRKWHYVDRLPDGNIKDGELNSRIDYFIRYLRDVRTPASQRSWALPWLIHLVGDIHQPLHVGNRDDEGGNQVEIENPFRPRQPFTNLHAWWDDLPGPPWLRGARLEQATDTLLAAYPKHPFQGTVALWEKESRDLSRESVYPPATGSILPIITEEFRVHSQGIANRRVVEAGYRLGRLLEDIFKGVSRETK